MNRDSFLALLRHHEGLRLEAYRCPAGKLTIGYGHTGPDVKEGMRIDKDEAERLLNIDAAYVISQSRERLSWFNMLGDTRQNVICSMIFNMGFSGFLEFKKMIDAILRKDFSAAADQMLSSKWSGQVGVRAVELAAMMRAGDTIH